MLNLMGQGKLKEAFTLIQASNPLPDVTGRVCPQEHQCQGVCTITGRPIEIGQLEWYLPERERLAREARGETALVAPDYVSPWERAEKPPIAVVGSGPAGLINAYLLSSEGYPVTVFEAFHDLGGVLRYGIPEFRLPNALIDDVVEKIDALGGKFVKNFVVGKTGHPAGPQGRRLLQDLRRHRRRPAALHAHPRRASQRRHERQRVPHPRQSDAGAGSTITIRRCRS